MSRRPRAINPRRRRVIAWVLNGCAGCAYGAMLAFGFHTTYAPTDPKVPVRVSFAATKVEAPESPESLAPPEAQLPVDVMPLVTEPPAKETPAARASEPVVAAESPDAEYGIPEALRGRTYPEKPGGSVLVLAVLVNSKGQLLDARIMVPSAYPFQDLRYLMLPRGTELGIEVPVPPGQTRWVDLRIRYERESIALP